jgi:CheY-like chemotaxis protein
MSLARLISVMDAVGIDLDASTILDILWLASQRRTFRSHEDTDIGSPAGTVTNVSNRQLAESKISLDAHRSNELESRFANPTEGSLAEPPSKETSDNRLVPVYPIADPIGAGRRASPVAVATAPPLSDSLGFMRALRPFQQRWSSARDLEVDEEATAHLTAELRAAGLAPLFPVLKPVSERWYAVDLVLEDDDAIELWRDLLKSFAQILRNTGAFWSVREWRLNLAADRGSDPIARDMLESPSGARLPAQALRGAERRLILFASHASSHHWKSGAYARLLTSWSTNSSVALLHLLPANSWLRTPLGEPDGICSNYRPGASNIMLQALPNWWSAIDQDMHDVVAIPMVELLPSTVRRWATMLMGRGESAPTAILPLHVAVAHSDDEKQPDLTAADLRKRVETLLENEPRAFELAVLLSTSPFTIPVARLIQEAHFGKADHRQLSELFVSGLILSMRKESDKTASGWYQIHPLATPFLRRSLRGTDAENVAANLVNRVSEHIKSVTGRQTQMTSFTPNSEGNFSLPDWAEPYAMIASQLRARPEHDPIEAVARLRKQLSLRTLGRLARFAGTELPLDRDKTGAEGWDMLLASRLTALDNIGRRFFAPEAKRLIAKIDQEQPLLGVQILWVDDRPSNNTGCREHFEKEGATVVEVLTTKEALATLNAEFDLIISDMRRPEGDREGFALLSELKAIKDAPPVIIFSDSSARSTSQRNEALRAGAIACTRGVDELIQIVHELIRKPRVDEHKAEVRIVVFVSYDLKDQQIAKVVTETLKSFGLDVFSSADLEIGRGYEEKISELVQKSQWFILIYSGKKELVRDMSWSFFELGLFRAGVHHQENERSDRICLLYDSDPPSELVRGAGSLVSIADRNLSLNAEVETDDSVLYEKTKLFEFLSLMLTRSATAPLRDISDPNVRKLIRNGVQRITSAFARNRLAEQAKNADGVSLDGVTSTTKRILVAGTGRYKLPDEVRFAADVLGERLATEGFDLVSGGWPGVDYIVSTRFSLALRSQGKEVSARYTQVLARGESSDFTIDESRAVVLDDWATGSVARSDAVVLVGGIGGTLRIFEAAIAAGKPVIPLGNSGGDATKAMNTLKFESVSPHTFLPKALQFADMPLGTETAAKIAIDGVLELVRLHLDPNLQQRYRAFAAVMLKIASAMDPFAANASRRSTARDDSGVAQYLSNLARAAEQQMITQTEGLDLATINSAAIALEQFAREQPSWLAFEFVEMSRLTGPEWRQATGIQIAITIALLRADAFDIFIDMIDTLKKSGFFVDAIRDFGSFEELFAPVVESGLLTEIQISRLNRWLTQNGLRAIGAFRRPTGPTAR